MPSERVVGVIGSGPVGAAVARRLVEAGREVVLLEKGPPLTTPPGSHLRNAAKFREDPDAFLPAVLEQCQFPCAGAAAGGLPEVPVTYGVGGQGIVWTNNCPRIAAHERWPEVETPDWEASCALAEDYLGVVADLCPDSRRQQSIAQALRQHLESRGQGRREVRTLPAAAHRLGGAIAYHATRDILESAGPARTRLTLVPSCEVKKLIVERGRVAAALMERDGRAETMSFEHLVIASGALDAPRLLVRSGIHPPALGEGVMFHPVLFAQVILDESLVRDAEAADPPPRLWIPPTPSHPWHSQILRDISPFAHPGEPADPGRLLEFQMFCPMECRPANRLLVGADDAVRFQAELSDQDRWIQRRMEEDARALAARLGRFRRGCEPMWQAAGFAHLMGTCRMGSSCRTSVADPSGRVWGIENLFLATAGLVPRPIAVNPTLTAVALGLRAVDCLEVIS